MKTTCPCCGGAVTTPLPIVDLNTNTLSFGDTRIHLRPQCAELMTALLERYPGAASYDYMIQRVWNVSEPDSAKTILKVLKWTLCRILRNIGYDITNTHDAGYRLVQKGDFAMKGIHAERVP